MLNKITHLENIHIQTYIQVSDIFALFEDKDKVYIKGLS